MRKYVIYFFFYPTQDVILVFVNEAIKEMGTIVLGFDVCS